MGSAHCLASKSLKWYCLVEQGARLGGNITLLRLPEDVKILLKCCHFIVAIAVRSGLVVFMPRWWKAKFEGFAGFVARFCCPLTTPTVRLRTKVCHFDPSALNWAIPRFTSKWGSTLSSFHWGVLKRKGKSCARNSLPWCGPLCTTEFVTLYSHESCVRNCAVPIEAMKRISKRCF